MPKSDQETTAIALAKKHWRTYAGCTCSPKEMPGGKGYDLGCKHKHVEVKGTGKKRPGFRSLTQGEFNAARGDSHFELWLITGIAAGNGTFHIIGPDDISNAQPITQYHVPLGEGRLESYRHEAE